MVSLRPLRAALPLLAVLVVAALVASPPAAAAQTDTAVGGAPDAQDPDDARLTVTDVTVSPGTPTVEDPVTLGVALRNSAGSPSAVAVDRVSVREVRTGENRTVAAAVDPGTLSPGDTLTVPVTARFEEPGEHRLVVVAVGTDDDGDRTEVRRPLSLVVERAPPRLDVRVVDPVADARTTVEVAVANPTEVELRDIRLAVDGDGVAPVDDGRTIPALGPGERVTVRVAVRPERAGDATVAVTAAYAAGSGVRATTTSRVPVEVGRPERDVGVRVEPADEDAEGSQVEAVQGVLGGRSTQQDDEDGPTRRVRVTVTNFGNVPARDVVVTPRADDRRLARRAVDGLAPGESAAVTVDLRGLDPGTVAFAVDYRAAERTGEATASYDYRPPTGRIELTGVDLALEDGQLRITGNAGNTGDGPIRGVVVRVAESAAVEPAYPRRSYFVGTVEGSEFAPFELTADVDADGVSTVPVRVSYTVDGTEVERTVELAYDDSVTVAETDEGPPVLLYAGAVVAVVPALAVGLLVYRRRESE
ncbi:hypothetical protein BRD13_07565 [Halobacteriales archaeon SW_5_70_135]|nr:MAG: hypothetical protein BRD13_07565 [Halobacteriales archaeon SW_5_70_135]